MKIYLVYGESGEYDDYINWVVCAYTNKNKAEEFKDKLNNIAKEYNLFERAEDVHTDAWWGREKKCKRVLKEFDEQVSIDYTGIEYIIKETELKEEK